MPRIEIDNVSDDAYVWVFGISPPLNPSQQAILLKHVDQFLAGWSAHGRPITSARQVRDGSFLVIAAENDTDRTGCSVDRLFGTLQKLEQAFGVSILDASRVFMREHGEVRTMDRSSFAERGSAQTRVFDTTVDSFGAIRSGAWEKAAAESWHRSLLKTR